MLKIEKYFVAVLFALKTVTVDSSSECFIDVYDSEIKDENIICEQLHGTDWQFFRWKMIRAFWRNSAVRAFIRALPPPKDIEEPGDSLCHTDRKQMLGFWAPRNTLCWIVQKHSKRQDVPCVKCREEKNCSGKNTKCVPAGHTRIKFLVYCNRFFFMDKSPSPCFDENAGFDEEPNCSDDDDDDDDPPPNRRSARRSGYFYFVYKDLPHTCCCTKCDCFGIQHQFV